MLVTQKKVRLADIAAEAGVSTVTVAKALNRTGGKNARVGAATAARIREIADRLNYRPDSIAQQLAGKKSKIIGVVMDSCAPQIHHERLSQMEMYAASKGYKFMIGQSHEDIEKTKAYAYEFAAYGVEGIICMSHLYHGAEKEISQIFNNVAKTVFIEKPVGLSNSYSVSVNTKEAYKKAVEYLVERGRRRIGLLQIKGFFQDDSMRLRKSYYLNGLKHCGLPHDEKLIQSVSVENQTNEASYLPAINELVFEQKVDAIIATNDEMAAMVIKILQKQQVRIPEEVSVIGYDNTVVAKLVTPSITTFDQNNDKISKAVVDLLLKVINGENIPSEKRNIIIDPQLIQRESA